MVTAAQIVIQNLLKNQLGDDLYHSYNENIASYSNSPSYLEMSMTNSSLILPAYLNMRNT